MKIIFIAPHLSQPRCIKRIQAFVQAGFEVEVYGFDNGLYSENVKDIPCPVHPNKIKRSASKWASLATRFGLLSDVRRAAKKGDLVYIFGIELALYYKLFFIRRRYLYEQADLNYAKLRSAALVSLSSRIDRRIIKKSLLTILTSQGFIEFLYGSSNEPENICLLPNKLHLKLKEIPRPSVKTAQKDKLVFAFIGAIRYPRTLFTFAKVIGMSFPQHEFHFWGEGFASDEAKALCRQYDNLFYHGRFTNPADLPHIYSRVDINVVCYDPVSGNVRIAEPNKLYESVFFRVPIVVSRNTFLEKRVNKWGVGCAVDAFDDTAVQQFVEGLSAEKIAAMQQNIDAIDVDELFDTTDGLIHRLKTLISTQQMG